MSFLQKHKRYILGIVGVIALLVLTNINSGTYLSGWDNLQTELHPWIGVKRAFFSVWQEYQSFGLLAGIAHGADFIRAIFVSILTFILPEPLVRYSYHFGMMLLGALGMYTLLNSSQDHTPSHKRKAILSIGSLFYLLNFGVIQLVSVPWESFSTFVGFLPWLVWSFLEFVRRRSHRKRYFVLLFVLNILATPQAYIQTIFVVYGLVLAVIGATQVVSLKNASTYLHRTIIACLLIIAANAFWLFPQMYFVMTGGAEHVQQAKINQIATEDVAYQNKEFGTIESFMRFEGFYSSLEGVTGEQLFSSWNSHLSNPLVHTLSVGIFLVILFGMLEKSRYRKSLIGLFILSAFVLLPNVPGISHIHSFIRSIPVVNEIFRSPFTKFITVYALVASYFFTYGLLRLSKYVPASRKQYIVPALASIVLLVYAIPAFRGHYFAEDMRTSIPSDYTDTIEYFKTVDPNQRIALMPDYTHWGWFFTDWGYNGSGFLWYGIEQPIVSRTFDVWSPASESYFWEIKAALEAEDVTGMERVLDKYAVDYLIVDHSLRPVTSDYRALQYDRLDTMLEESDRIEQFGFGTQLSLYTFDRSGDSESFVSLGHSFPSVGPSSTYMSYDAAYADFGTYVGVVGDDSDGDDSLDQGLSLQKPDTKLQISADHSNPDVYYPFRNFFTQTRLFDDQWTIQEFDEAFVVSGRLPAHYDQYELSVPSTKSEATLYINEEERTFTTNISFDIDKESSIIHVTVPKTQIVEMLPSYAQSYLCGGETDTDQHLSQDDEHMNVHIADSFVRVFSNHGTVPCLGYGIPFLDQKYGYLVSIKNRNLEGRRLFMSIADQTKNQPYIEDRLLLDEELFVIPPRFEFGRGYTFTFQNASYANLPSVNLIDELSVYHLPYEEISDIRLVRQGMQLRERLSGIARGQNIAAPSDGNVNKRQYHAYTVDLSERELRENEHLILWQAYHQGWRAYIVADDPVSQYVPMLAGRRLQDHVRVNTWAQGWELPDQCTRDASGCRIVLVFWPQYLQYIGFVVLLGVGVWVFRSRS